jgi:hypothetical protein
MVLFMNHEHTMNTSIWSWSVILLALSCVPLLETVSHSLNGFEIEKMWVHISKYFISLPQYPYLWPLPPELVCNTTVPVLCPSPRNSVSWSQWYWDFKKCSTHKQILCLFASIPIPPAPAPVLVWYATVPVLCPSPWDSVSWSQWFWDRKMPVHTSK